MKGIFVTLMMLVSTLSFNSDVSAHERKCKPVVTVVKMVKPCDIVRSVGAWTKESTCRTVEGVGKVLKGTGEVLSAPFKSRFNWPRQRMYRWHRGYWYEVNPTPKLEIEEGSPTDGTHFIPHPITPEEQETIVLYEAKF
mgnify:CR=1 FL=1